MLLTRSAGKLRVGKDSQGLVIREGFMEEAAAVLDLKELGFGLAERKGGHLKSRKHRNPSVEATMAERLVEGAERSRAASSSSSSHLLTAPGRWGWGQNIQRQGPALKKVPF